MKWWSNQIKTLKIYWIELSVSQNNRMNAKDSHFEDEKTFVLRILPSLKILPIELVANIAISWWFGMPSNILTCNDIITIGYSSTVKHHRSHLEDITIVSRI